MRAAFLAPVLTRHKVTDREAMPTQQLEEFLHIRVGKNRSAQMIDPGSSRIFQIPTIGQRDDMSGLGGLTFSNVTSNPVIDLGFPTLPAFATRDEPTVRELVWINTHGLRSVSLNAPMTKGECFAAAQKYFDFFAAACIPRRILARDALLFEGRGPYRGS